MAGLYWHFVDIVWIFLFPLLYLVEQAHQVHSHVRTRFAQERSTIAIFGALMVLTARHRRRGLRQPRLVQLPGGDGDRVIKATLVVLFFMHVKYRAA